MTKRQGPIDIGRLAFNKNYMDFMTAFPNSEHDKSIASSINTLKIIGHSLRLNSTVHAFDD